jgi:chromosome segregation ATPase
MQDEDVVLEVLRLARAEGALEGDGLEAFAKGLRERADLVIEERVSRAEAQVERLERELAWRRETNAGLEETIRELERELGWRRETNARLEETTRELERENAWRRETNEKLERENVWRRATNEALESDVAGLRAEREASAEAHDRLLSHHRDSLSRVAAELAAVAALPLYSLRSGRRRLVSLAAAIRGETA